VSCLASVADLRHRECDACRGDGIRTGQRILSHVDADVAHRHPRRIDVVQGELAGEIAEREAAKTDTGLMSDVAVAVDDRPRCTSEVLAGGVKGATVPQRNVVDAGI